MNKWLCFILLAIITPIALGTITKPNGATDVTVYFFVTDPNGDPNTSIAEEDIDIYYIEQGSAMAAKVDMTALDAANSAHSDNKGYDCGQGILRVDFPDAAFDGGIGKTVELLVRDTTGATDDSQKDKIFPITVQLGAYANLNAWDGNDLTHDSWNTTTKTPKVDAVAWSVAAMSVATMFSDAVSGDGFTGIGAAVRYYLGANITDVNDGSIVDTIRDHTTALSNLQSDTDLLDTSAELQTLIFGAEGEGAAAKAILDKLDTALVLDGAVYQWTENSLSLAPTSDVTDIQNAIGTSDTSLVEQLREIKNNLP